MRGGRPVAGFALGAATTFARANSDLQGQVVATIAAGDVHYQTDLAEFLLDYSNATASYQAAGQSGAVVVGPEIDAAGAAAITKPLTHQAWTLNAQLQALPKTGATGGGMPSAYYTQADAQKAKALATAMVVLYSAAIAQGMAATGTTNPPQPASTPQQPTSVWPVLALGTVVAAVATAVITHS